MMNKQTPSWRTFHWTIDDNQLFQNASFANK
jgi:hypothetical protein